MQVWYESLTLGVLSMCAATGLFVQEHLTEQELEELEACEEWVALQASMEELEQDHLVAIALR